MKKGDVLGGFRVVTEPTNANAGMSQWAKAEQSGVTYFMKRFLAPKYPTPRCPGTPDGHERRRRDCEAFESRQLAIIERLNGNPAGAGHLITPKVFFRVGPSYFKVTDLVDVDSNISLSGCSSEDVAIALRSLVASVGVVHEAGIVHSDLKPDNVLFERTSGGRLACKLIDFDESYLAGLPPSTGRIAGDPYFYSPEMLSYVRQLESVRAADLTTASDTFALGVLLHILMTDTTVAVDGRYTYPCEAVHDGQTPRLHHALEATPVGATIRSMLALDPTKRPTIGDVLGALGRKVLVEAIDAIRTGSGTQAPDLASELSDGHTSATAAHTSGTASGSEQPPVSPADDDGADAGKARRGEGRLRFNMGRSSPTRTPPEDSGGSKA